MCAGGLTAEPLDGPFTVGGWYVEPALNRISRDGESIQLELKVMDVLVCLAERAGEVVPRETIVDTVWATEFIADNTLTHAIAEIRRAFGDDAREPEYIETIPKRGYRLIAPLTVEPATVTRFPSPATAGTHRVERSPYPGLAAFTESDAEFFFGREAEVAQLWRKLTSRRLLAVIGPSGVGKSSFLRAGVIPAAPEAWGILICQPGEAPFAALARALAPAFEGDAEAFSKATDFQQHALHLFTRWRQHHTRAVLMVDQFEELFTLNPPEVQQRFSDLLGALARDADVHVVLSMRDDYLYRCQAYPPLRPIVDGLMALQQPDADPLRRALVEPARAVGFRFEDDDLPDAMVAEVVDERAALPLLAFAVARLWEKRDRDRNLLTRQAYEDVGGVAGALARHAEATVDRIGHERLPMVREIFRNLVTAEGTRAVREWDELLSVFEEGLREPAEEVVRELIDARLLTSYEVKEEDREPTRRVEIIHESLLANWPRLVGWRTQDADASRLRDELRQASRTWDEHDRSDDLLWTGSAYREYTVWRERYPGGLSEIEAAFGDAMTSLATRRRRRRRIASVAAVVMFALIGAVFAALWRRSVQHERRAEAQKLFALAQIELDQDRTASLAYAIKSLELADDQEVRTIAVRSLWQGPQKFILDDRASWSIPFSPDGRRLVKSMDMDSGPHLEVLGSDGGGLILDPVHESTRVSVDISPDSDLLASWDWNNRPVPLTVVLRSLSRSEPLAIHTYEEDVLVAPAWDRRRLLLLVQGDRASVDVLDKRGGYHTLGSLAAGYSSPTLDSHEGKWLGAIRGDEVVVLEIGDTTLGQPRRLGLHGGARQALFHPRGDFLVTASPDGEIRFWDPTGSEEPRVFEGPSNFAGIRLMADGSMLVAYARSEAGVGATVWSIADDVPRLLRRYGGSVPVSSDPSGRVFLGNDDRLLLLAAPPEAEPIPVDRNSWDVNFHPQSDWVSTTGKTALLWHLSRPLSMVIARLPTHVWDLEFERRGDFLVAAGMRNYWVRLWPLGGPVPAPSKTIFESREHGYFAGISVSPDGTQLAVTTQHSPLLVPVSGDRPRVLEGHDDAPIGVAFSPSGRLAAVPSGGWSAAEPDAVHVWEVSTGRHLEPVLLDSKPTRGLHFLSEDQFLVATDKGLMKHGLDRELGELVLPGMYADFAVSRDGSVAILRTGRIDECSESAVVFDVETGMAERLSSHGSDICSVDISPDGSVVVTGNTSGEIRVGPFTGEEPHLLVADSFAVPAVAVDPRGRWIASSGLLSKADGWRGEGVVRLWPMPDLSRPPLHTLPRDELIAKLKTLTNLRVVRDEDSATGWRLTHDPFPGWETVPTW